MKNLIISAVAATALTLSAGAAMASSDSHDDNFDVFLKSQGQVPAHLRSPSNSQAYSNEGGYITGRPAPIRSFLFGTEPGWRSYGYHPYHRGYQPPSGRGINNRDANDFDYN